MTRRSGPGLPGEDGLDLEAIAADDALLDSLGSRRGVPSTFDHDPVAHLLARWVDVLDEPASSLQPVGRAAGHTAGRRLDSDRRPESVRRTRALVISGVALALMMPAGLAVAAGSTPTTPYRAALSFVTGGSAAGDTGNPAELSPSALQQAEAALASGDTNEAARLLRAMAADPSVTSDPGLMDEVLDLAAAVNDANPDLDLDLRPGGGTGAGSSGQEPPGTNNGGTNNGGTNNGGTNNGGPSDNKGTGVGNGSGNGKGQGSEPAGSGGGTSPDSDTPRPPMAPLDGDTPSGASTPPAGKSGSAPGRNKP